MDSRRRHVQVFSRRYLEEIVGVNNTPSCHYDALNDSLDSLSGILTPCRIEKKMSEKDPNSNNPSSTGSLGQRLT
jgi:hypothetical protein